MPAIDRRLVQHFDWVLLGLVGALLAAGLANLFSATHGVEGAGLAPELRRQLLALTLGSVAVVFVLAIDYRRLERWAIGLYVASTLLLLSTLVLAPITRGNQGWLDLGPVHLQPSELSKLALVVALARWFHRNPPQQIRRLRDLAIPAAIAGVPVGIILLQRDMGVAVLTLLIAATYLPFVRIPARAWASVAAVGVLGLIGLWSFALRPYQRSRILDFVDPGRDPLDSGYQAIQSRIAIGSGGLFGRGFLEGTQTQLRFLPTQHTDFAFSVLAEEWGFVGSISVLGVYLLLLLWGLRIARDSKDGFGAMIAVGIVGILFWPAVINVSMVLGLAPVIGVPLPLFSYGGSALIATLLGVGLLLNVSMRRYVF
jgi:rod shape determining protein RodA